MPDFLLDTRVLIWWAEGSKRIGPRTLSNDTVYPA
jgi:PIN domain nuclease of toxin-antitoxin system